MPSIDERVVQMKFDNKQFESGVSQSEKTLDRFKKSLDFKGVEDSIKNLENAVNKVDLSGLSNAVESIADKFSPLGILGVAAMQKIADAALDAGGKVADAFFGFSDMSAGQSKYETYTRAVQTITNATGKSVAEVEKVLGDLQTYTDETSYDFAEMVSSIGKFTSAGVDLEVAEESMEGIANWAAKSGAGIQEANRAFYNLSQAIATGSVKLIDWKSIENANMATKEFKELAIQTAIELGVLQDRGNGIGSIVTTNEEKLKSAEKQLEKAKSATKDRASKLAAAQEKVAAATKETTVDFKNFNSTLSEGWLTSDVLIKVLEKYANDQTAYEAAQKALNFSEAIQAVKDALSSGWMESYRYIFGNLDEAKELWTNVANALYDYVSIFTDWRNEVLKSWHEMGGYNDLIEAASNLWQTFMNIVKGVGQALADVFPILKPENMTKALRDGTKQLKDWSAGLLKMFGLYEEVKEEEKDVADSAEEAAEKTEEIATSATNANEAMVGLSQETKTVSSNIGNIETGLKRGMRGDNVKQLQKQLMKFGFGLDKFGADGIFGPETQAALKALQREIGVTETGVLDEATKAALQTDEAMQKLQKHAQKGLGIGDRGEDVKKLQKSLNKYLGDSEKLAVDGILGPKTEAAIKKIQKKLGVEQTGTWDKATQAAVKYGKIALFNLEKIDKKITKDSPKDDIKALQDELIKFGYLDQKTADGIYGPKTEAAVKKLQKSLGLKETGEWDRATAIAVHNAQQQAKAANASRKANGTVARSASDAAKSVKKSNEEVKKSSEEAEKASGKTTIKMKKLQAIARGFGSAIKIIGNFVGAVSQVARNVAGMFSPLIKDVLDFVYFFSGMIENLANQLEKNDTYKKFVEDITNFFEPIATIVGNAHDAIHGFFKEYTDYLKELNPKTPKENNTFETFFSFLDSYLEKQGPFGQALKTGIQLVRSLLSVISSVVQIVVKVGGMLFEIGKRVLTILSPVWNMLSTIFQAGVGLFSAFAEKLGIFTKNFTESSSFTEWLKNLDENLPNIQKKVQDFCDTILGFLGLGDGIDSIDFVKTIDNIIDSIKKFLGLEIDTSKITDKIDTKGIVDTIKDKLIGVYTGIRDWITGLFKSEEVGAVKEGVMKLDGYKISIGVIGIAIALIAKQLYTVTNSFISIGNNVSKVINNIKGISKEVKISKRVDNIDTIAGALLKFAGTIGILAASVFVLAQLKWEQLIVGLTGLVAVMGLLIGSVFLLKKILKDAGNIQDAIGALISLGTAIGALAGSVVALAALDWGGLARGLVGTAALLGACLLLFKLLDKMPLDIKSTGGAIGLLTSLGTALNMLVRAVMTLSKLEPGKMIQGLLGVAAIMLGLFVFTKFLDKTKISFSTVAALFTAALAIDMLIGGFLIMTFAMKLLSIADIVKGIIGVTVIVLEMAALLKLIEKIHPSIGSILSLLPVAISLDLLIVGFSAMVLVMKHAKLGDVVKAFVGIGVLILGVVALLKLIEKIHPSIGSILALLPVAISLDLLIGGFIALTVTLKNAGISDMIKAIASIGVLVLSVALLTKLMEKAKPSIGAIFALIPIALALDLLIVGFIGLTLAMKSVTASTIIKSIVSLAAMVITLGVVSKSIAKVNNGIQGIKAALTIIPLVLGLAGLAAIFAIFARSMQQVSVGALIKSIISIEVMVHAMGALTSAMEDLDIKTAIEFFIAGGTLALLIYTFSKALERVKNLDGSKMLAFATALSELFIAFAIAGGIAGKLGAMNSFLGIIAIAAGIIAVIAAFSALLSIPAVEDFLTNGAEKLGKLVGSFIGAMKAAEFESFNKAVGEMSSIDAVDQGKVDNAIAAAQAVADFGAGLPSKSLINKAADFFFGSELKQFSGDMTAFGKGFNSFVREISSITISSGDLTAKTSSAIAIAESIKQFGESLQKKPITDKIVDAIFGSELNQFSFDMVCFGTGFNGFATQIAEIENYGDVSTKTASAITIAKSINEFGESLEKKPISEKIADAIFGSELKQFSGDMASFGTGFNSYAKQIGLVEIASDLEAKTASAISIANSIKEFGESLKEKTIDETITDAIFGSELSQFSGDMVSFSTGFKGYVAQMNNLEDVGDLEGKTEFAIRIADSIRQFSEALKQKTNSEKAADFFFGSELEQFSGDMVTFGTGYNSYAKEMAKIEDVGDLDTKTEYAIQIAGSIRDFSDGLKNKSFAETVTDTLFGSELDQFSGDMSNFASKFNQFTSTMSAIKISPLLKINVDTAVGIAGQIKALADGLSGKEIGTKITDAIFGSELSQFSGDMSTFASKFNEFATTMGGITADPDDVDSKTDVAISIAKNIAAFLETIGGMNIETKAQGISAWFGDKTKGETVIDSVAELAQAMTNSASSFSGLASGTLADDVSAAVTALEAVAGFLNYLSSDQVKVDTSTYDFNGYLGDKLTQLLGGLSSIAGSLNEFSNNTKDLDIENIASITKSICDFINFGLVGAEINSENILSGLSAEAINSRITTIASDVLSAIIGNKESFSDSGLQIATFILESFSNEFSQENEAFKTAGENLALGLAEGVEVKSEIAVKAVEVLAQSMLDKVISVFDSHSPSEETYAQGENFVDGLIKAVGDKGKELTESVENLGNNALGGLTEVFGGEKDGEGLVDNLAKTFFGKGDEGIISIENLGGDLSDTLDKAFNGEITGKDMIEDVTNGLFGDGSKTESEIDKYVDSVIGDIDKEIKNNSGSIDIGDAIDYDATREKTKKHVRLTYGDISEEVRQMQSDLMALGYNLDKFGADGIFGPETKAALNDFKRDYGLAVNGVFDTKASNKLTEALTESGSQAKYSEAGKIIYNDVESGLKSGAEASEESVATIILESLKVHSDKFVEQGKAFTQSLADGLTGDKETIETASEILGKQMLSSIKTALAIAGDSSSKEAVSLGANFVLGLVEGIRFKAYLAQKAAEYAAELMKRGVENRLNINSPSKVGEQLGKYFVEGLAIGQNKNADDAKNASETAANGMISVAKTTLSNLYSILDEGVSDYQPVIRPVVDMTNVQAAKDSLPGLFNSAGIPVKLSSEMAEKVAEGHTSADRFKYRIKDLDLLGDRSGTYANGNKPGSFDALAARFDKLAERMENLKIVLDTGEVVGATSSAYDKQFGIMAGRRERGN